MAEVSPGAGIAAKVAAFLGACAILLIGFLGFAKVENDLGTNCGTVGHHEDWQYIIDKEPIPRWLYGCNAAFDARENKMTASLIAAGVLFGVAITITVANRRKRQTLATSASPSPLPFRTPTKPAATLAEAEAEAAAAIAESEAAAVQALEAAKAVAAAAEQRAKAAQAQVEELQRREGK